MAWGWHIFQEAKAEWCGIEKDWDFCERWLWRKKNGSVDSGVLPTDLEGGGRMNNTEYLAAMACVSSLEQRKF